MVVQTAAKATANALSYKHCQVGLCLGYTRTWLEIGSRDPSAAAALHNVDEGHRHRGDRTPPRGAPVFWTGGSHGYGHIALALMPLNGVARIRTTDVPGGTVATVPLSYIEDHWGFKYEGWTETLNGVAIPYLQDLVDDKPADEHSEWASGDVYLSKLRHGQVNSDSVRRLQYRLRNAARGGTPNQPITGSYLGRTVSSVKHWQETTIQSEHEFDDGSRVGPVQAKRLFGDAYTIHNS